MSCTPDRPGARGDAVRLIEAKSGPGEVLSGADPNDLTIVTNGGTCSKLRKQFSDTYNVQGANSPYIATYYQVGNRFIVHINTRDAVEPEPAPPGQVLLIFGKSQVLVYDDSFNELGAFLL